MRETTHYGWTISYCPYRRCYEAIAPDYEPTWAGEEEGWIDGERFTTDTLAEAIAEIEERYAEEA